MRSITVIAIALLLSAAPFAQETTGLAYNGRAWNKFGDSMKLGYVVGFSEGRGICDDDRLPCLMNFGEIIRILDRFYTEPENLLISIPIAIHLIAKKAAGMPPAQVEKDLAEARLAAHMFAEADAKREKR